MKKILFQLKLKTPARRHLSDHRTHTPVDVFERLTSSYATVAELARVSGQQALVLKADSRGRTDLYPGDNYDLAALVLSEVAYLYALSIDELPPPLPPDPREISVTDVYEQVKLLDHHLMLLLNHARQHPQWIERNRH